MLDILIKNAKVIDGSGKTQAFRANLGVKSDKISWIGSRLEKSKKVIDANGQYISPGFIDAQNHSDSFWTIFDYPHQDSMLVQGITTITVGHSGASLAPLPSDDAFKSTQKWHSLSGVNFNWQYFDEFLEEVAKHEIGVNLLSLVGHSTIRRGLLGDKTRNVTEQELKLMARLVSSSLKTGAFGLSFGLQYAHEFSTSKEELIALSQIVQLANGVLSVQIRDYGPMVLEALDEAIEIAAQTGVKLKISHLKIEGEQNWKNFDDLLLRLEKAHQKGIFVQFDVYPYTTSWRVLYTYLPKWAYEGGNVHMLKRLSEPYHASKIAKGLAESKNNLGGLVIAHASSAPHLVGKTLHEIAKLQGSSVTDSLITVLRTNGSDVIVFDQNILEEQMLKLIAHPLSMVASDGAGFPFNPTTRTTLAHPRCFGTMPKFIELVVKNKFMTIESAIEKITGKPAKLYGLVDRGELSKGKKADIIMFNPKKVADRSTLKNPFLKPLGISNVIVNGKVSIEDGNLTSQFAGEVLKPI